MAYKVIILYQLYMPSYFLGTFTEYPSFYFSFYFCNGFHDNLCYNPQDQKMLEQDLVLFISGA